MSVRTLSQVILLTVVLLFGASAGLVLSLHVWPVTCQNAEPFDLDRSGRCNWAAWAADAYASDGDLDAARERVASLGAAAVDSLCALAAGVCPTCRSGQADAGAALVAALGLACSADAGTSP